MLIAGRRENNSGGGCRQRHSYQCLAHDMRTMRILVGCWLTTSLAYSQAVSREAVTGSLCVAAVQQPKPGEKFSAEPKGLYRVRVFSMQIDNQPTIRALADRGVLVGPLSLKDKHTIRIFGDGRQVESFRFKFSPYSSSELCLLYERFYQDWVLWDCKQASAWRLCKKAPPKHSDR